MTTVMSSAERLTAEQVALVAASAAAKVVEQIARSGDKYGTSQGFVSASKAIDTENSAESRQKNIASSSMHPDMPVTSNETLGKQGLRSKTYITTKAQPHSPVATLASLKKKNGKKALPDKFELGAPSASSCLSRRLRSSTDDDSAQSKGENDQNDTASSGEKGTK